MKQIKTKRIIRVPGILPMTWIESYSDFSVSNDTIIKKFLKEKSIREKKDASFKRWTRKDNIWIINFTLKFEIMEIITSIIGIILIFCVITMTIRINRIERILDYFYRKDKEKK